MFFRLIISILFSLFFTKNIEAFESKKFNIIICGVCKNIEQFLHNDFKNIEQLGAKFNDYRVVIYENNSTDNTKSILTNWANNNSRVVLITENFTTLQLLDGINCFDWQGNPSRMELIAKARNHILDIIKKKQFDDFDFVVMADLDFQTAWPIDEIINIIEGPQDWDAVTANGQTSDGTYFDRYALRNDEFPFGPELLGEFWWKEIIKKPLKLQGLNRLPVFSAFGGLAIYKRNSILHSLYTGYVTNDLNTITRNILNYLPSNHSHFRKYLNIIGAKKSLIRTTIPIIFRLNSGYYNFPVCCEHVTFHMSMISKGFNKIFIDPKLIMVY